MLREVYLWRLESHVLDPSSDNVSENAAEPIYDFLREI